jgi:hypothetical protein
MGHDRREMIIAALKRKGVDQPCPRCGNTHFSIIAETMIQIQTEPGAAGDAATVVPAVFIGCTNCGYLTPHALGALDLAPEAAHAR